MPTQAGYKYFLTIVDDCTRFTWVFLMRHKSKAKNIIPRFFSMVETQFNKKVKKFRSDNAPMLRFHDFFSEKGVVYQFSCVEQPEHNSVVERKHQHLVWLGYCFSILKFLFSFGGNVFSLLFF